VYASGRTPRDVDIVLLCATHLTFDCPSFHVSCLVNINGVSPCAHISRSIDSSVHVSCLVNANVVSLCALISRLIFRFSFTFLSAAFRRFSVPAADKTRHSLPIRSIAAVRATIPGMWCVCSVVCVFASYPCICVYPPVRVFVNCATSITRHSLPYPKHRRRACDNTRYVVCVSVMCVFAYLCLYV
jgi:hypothetical protein